MDLQSYYRNLYASYRDEEEEKRLYDPSSFDDSLIKYADDNPEKDKEIAKAKGLAPGYADAPVQSWIPVDIAGTFQKILETAPEGVNPNELETRLNTAYYLAKTKNISFDDAFENLDSYIETDYGKATGPRSGLDSLINIVNTGIINRQIFKYANELKHKVGAFDGQYKDWTEIEKDPLYNKIRELETRLPTQDVYKRSWPIETLKKVMQVIPSITESLGKGALASIVANIGTTALMGGTIGSVAGPLGTVAGIATGATGGAIVSIIPTIASLASGLATSTAVALNTQEAEGGAAFYDLIKFRDPVTGERINPVQAARWSRVYEAFSAAVEMMQTDVFFRPFNNALNSAQKNAFRGAVKSSLESISDASARAGTLLQLANTTAGKYLLEVGKRTAQETFEEDLQEGLQIWTTEQAKRITNKLDNTSISPIQKEEIVKRIVDTTVSSAIGLGVLSLAPAAQVVWSDTISNRAEGVSEGVKEFVSEKLSPEPITIAPEQPAKPPLFFKSYESAPGVMEFRGTTDTEGQNRKLSVEATVVMNDEGKTATISGIGTSKTISKDPREMTRQIKETIKNIHSELPRYEILFTPKNTIEKQVKTELEAEIPNIFKMTQEAPQQPQEAPVVKLDQKATVDATALQQEAIQGNQKETKAEQEAKFSPEELARSQREGAARMESILDRGGYKFTMDTEAEVAKIKFHPDLPNFKEGVNAQGVGKKLVGPPDTLGMAPIILYETNDGQRYIVTGRHRLDLWKEYGYPTIPAQILKESDGYTISDMAVIDAENNIRDNQGTEKDYAKYFERIRIGEKEAERRGLLRNDKGKLGFYIGTFASPALRSLYYSGKISAAKAGVIAEIGQGNDALQSRGMKAAEDKRLSAAQLRESMYQFKLDYMRKTGGGKQDALFGDGDWEDLADQVELGKAAADIKDEISQEISVLKQAARLTDTERSRFLAEYGFKVDNVGGLQARLDKLMDLQTRWSGELWTSDPELVYQAKVRAGQATEEEIATYNKQQESKGEQAEVVHETAPLYGDKNPITSPSPWIYKAEQIINNKVQGPVPGNQILKTLQAAGVKSEELKWTGLDEFLATNKKKTPQEVMDFLEANKLQIQEVYKRERTKFSEYALPGGENYREVLFTLPRELVDDGNGDVRWDREISYVSQHWDEPNVLAHTRLDDRETPDGKRVLFLEEVQSDWHQDGRKRGYKTKESLSQIQARLKEKYGESWQFAISESEAEEMRWAYENPEGIPEAPFAKTWHEFVFKRILRMAVEEGYDAIGWTTGEQQTDRYDLSRQISLVSYNVGSEEAEVYAKDEELDMPLMVVKKEDLEATLGKDVTNKLLEGTPDEDGNVKLSGIDLRVGGSGMKGFYDKILVDFANKYGKKWGARVQQIEIGTESKQQSNGDYYQETAVVHSLPVTDLMRVAVPEGQYLFEKAPSNYGLDISKAEYRRQMLKAREITKLMADNSDGFFIDEVKNMVSANTSALIDALQNAKSQNVAFASSAEGGYSATLTPAQDGSSDWDINLFINGDLLFAYRFKDRVEAIENLFTDIASYYGSAATWKVIGEPGEFELTPDQIGDIIQKEEAELDLFEYDDATIDLVYGSKEAFDAANKQLDIFKDDGAGDFFTRYGYLENENLREPGVSGNNRRSPSPVSSLLGKAGEILHPQIKENRKRQRRISFVGQTISGHHDLEELFQVYRNPQIETFHLIYLDESGKILAHNAMSSGVPGRTVAVEYKQHQRNAYSLSERMKRLGASKVYLLHNHPSGNPAPSTDDVTVTNYYLSMLGNTFAGHIILNHNKAALIDANIIAYGVRNNIPIEKLADEIKLHSYSSSETSYDVASGNHIDSPEEAERYALSMLGNRSGGSLIITDYHYRILEWRVWNNTNLKSIYQAVKESGGSHAFFATDNRTQHETLYRNVVMASDNGGKYNVMVDLLLLNRGQDKTVRFDHKVIHGGTYLNHYNYRMSKNSKYRIGRFVMESDLAQEAGEFDSYQEFKNAYVSEGEDDSELKKAWAEKQNKKSSAELDQDFISMLQADRQKLRDFLEANGADLFNRKTPRKNMSVVDATSYRLATGGVVSDATIDRAMMLIEKHPVEWRKRFADLSGELWSEGKPQDFDIAPPRRKSLATLQAKHKEAISKLPDGAEVIGSAEELVAKTEELRRELENKKRALKELQDRFSYGEKRIVDMVRQQKDLEKRIWAGRVRAKLSPEYKEIVKELETQAKELKSAIAERTMALSPQSGMKGAAYAIAKKEVKDATDALKKQYAIEKAKRTERGLKLYYAKMISRPVSKSIDFKIGNQIREIQKQLDPNFRKDPTAMENGRPLNNWTVEELQALYEEVEALRDYGRNMLADKLFDRSMERAEKQSKLKETAAKTGKKKPAYYSGTDENAAQQKAEKNLILAADVSLTTIHRIARELDGGVERGNFYREIVEREREAFTEEKNNIDRRYARIEAKMRDLGLNRDAMYRDKIKLGEQTISKWEAISLYIGMQNQRTAAAIIYGNMMTQEERESLSDEEFYYLAMQNYGYVKDAIATLSPEEIELAKTFILDGDIEFDRLANATYVYENRIPEKEGVYFPHERKSRSGEGETEEEVIDQVLARAARAQRPVGKQPTINRIEISPRHQTAISLDAFQVYRRGIERQEHYIAYAKYISDMNSIIKNGKSAAAFRETVRLYHGQRYLDYLDRWISEAANPKAFTDFNKPVQGIDRFFKMMRGPLGVAYLGYRASRGVFQLITSPAPYLPYAGTFMISRMVKNLNPAEFMKVLSFAKENSAFIRHRTINPTDAYIKNYLETNPNAAKRRAMEVAGAIMEWSDMWSVSTGWMAIYEKTTASLKDSGKNKAEIHKEAIREADRVTIETQPTYRHQDLSPAFKKDSELERFLFQFQTPLNVIYNQLFHDTRADWKSGHKARSLGIVAGYLSVMGLIAVITAPKHDDDEEDKKIKYFLSGMATVPLETIPFIGSIASGYVESLITDERYWRDDQIFPGVKKVFDGASRMMNADDKEAAWRAFWRMLEGAGMLSGFPTSAIREYYRVIFDGEWGALWGQRKGD